MRRRELVAVIAIAVIVVAAGVQLEVVSSEVVALQQIPTNLVHVFVYMPGTTSNFRDMPVILLNVTLVYRHTFLPNSANRSVNIQIGQVVNFAQGQGFNITSGGVLVPAGVLTKIRLVLQTGTVTDNTGTVYALRAPGGGNVTMPLAFSLYGGGSSTLTLTMMPNATQISAAEYRFGFSYSEQWVELTGGVSIGPVTATGTV
jgi:hypothetical protein